MDIRPLLPLERAELTAFLRTLSASDWAAPTANDGWSVHDVALHLLGNDIGRVRTAGRGAAERGELGFADLADVIETSNETWVRATRRIEPSLLVDLLDFVGPRVDAAFAAVDMEAPGLAVAWTGDGPSPWWLDIAREYTERWVHGAQIRLAVASEALTERRWLHPVLDAFMRCLPRAYADMAAKHGTTVRVAVNGDAGGDWFVRRGADRWHLVSAIDGEPTATVRLSADVAWRLLSRTRTVDATLADIETEGDAAIASVATRATAIMTTKL